MASIRALSATDDRATFRSGNEDLDRFFRRFAAVNQFSHHLGVTYVAVEGEQILGFATVASATLSAEDFAATRTRGLPQYPLPALRLARLAVREGCQGKGIGTALLRYVFTLAQEMSTRVGCVGVLVDAKPSAAAYYEGFGFERRIAIAGQSADRPEPVIMFLPLDRVRSAIGPGFT